MSTLEEFPQVKDAYAKYVEKFNSEPTNPTQLIKFCQKNEIQGVTWSKCSKYFKILNGQSTAINKAQPPKNFMNRSHHKKTTSSPMIKSPKSKDSSSSPDTNTNGVSPKSSTTTTSSNGSASAPPKATPPKVISPNLSPSNHRRTQSAIDAKTHKANIDKKTDSSKPFQTVMINELFTDLKEDPIGPQDDDSKSQTNGDTKRVSFLLPTNGSKNKQRLSKTPPPSSFKSIFIDQKLGALSSTQESAPAATIQKTVKKEVKKHPLLEKPWNRHKSSVWPKNRMAMTFDLKKWLIDNKFDKFASKLYHFGIESMKDLRLLMNEDMIEDLCGKNGVKMTIIYRRKFIKKVLAHNRSTTKNRSTDTDLGGFGSLLMQSISPKKEQHKFQYEMEAVQALTKRIQQTTKSIQITKKLQSEIEEQTKTVKQNVIDDFDELIKVIAIRKKQLLNTIDTNHKITSDRLDEQYKLLYERSNY
eukprot:CAMPEP_0201596204 /NCGR_PEP_ID=MMETSP0190_2-20130828/192964_1 /ASSEMBLY_ACC=CAM_ASM_000263 /TAXON_ID=37353 /ORGANISM="Rosalina sp." /LENGTH=471 /DNA_ID=CAMNT_0048056471 /DNA_START=16 /DNA_END=1431 /DNA_ORIENTATION=+